MTEFIKSSDVRAYICIDLKSFYASVECAVRHLDPMKTNLVVADASRTEKTICLAVSPSLKALGISGRARLFEVVQRVKEVNNERRRKAPGHMLTGSSVFAEELAEKQELQLDYLVAKPRMSLYMEVSTQIYQIYLRYISPEDIHVYSIDEVFIDATQYLRIYNMTARELAATLIREILRETGITATGGVGTNLYLAKIAMDIMAKKVEPDEDGNRIAELDELSYRRQLWTHRPLTDFWRVGSGYAAKLEAHGMVTMGDVARCSIGGVREYYNEELLYKLFGVNAELLIDHAWGWEPCTIAQIKAYKPESNSISSGQVLSCPYSAEKTRIIVKEMTEQLVLELVDKCLVTDQLVLDIGYDINNLTDQKISGTYQGEIAIDRYGRKIPKHAHGTINLSTKTSSTKLIMEKMLALYDRIIDQNLFSRRITVTACRVISEYAAKEQERYEQLDLFTDYKQMEQKREEEKKNLEKEKKLQHAMIDIKKKFGKNAILKGTNFEEGATAIERNGQIGGHKA